MAEHIWVIYKHTNKINGKSYIGQTRTPTKVRWKSGFGYSKNQAVFANAIEKYGWDNFEHEIIETGIKSLEAANAREKYWIAHYHTYINDPECNGYNMTPGGGATDLVRQTIEKDGVYQKVFVVELPRFEAEGWRVLSKKEVSKLWYDAHREELNARSRERGFVYRAKHKEELAAKNKKYAEDNREKVKAKQKEWMNGNVERIKAQKAAWQEKNKEQQKEKARQYYLANREKIIARASKWQQENKEERAVYKAEYQRNYRKKKLEEINNEKS